MRELPYIGVTGAQTIEDIHHLSQTIHKLWVSTKSGINHQPMIGLLASLKTLRGESVDNLRYPKVETLPKLFNLTQLVGFRTIHYNTQEKTTLSKQIQELFKTGGLYDRNLCRGLQLNMVWPQREELIDIKKYLPRLKIILQLSSSILRGTPESVAQRVESYEGLVRFVLIDPSGGKNQEFQINEVLDLYHQIKYRSPQLILGFAGGFNGGNIEPRCQQLAQALDTKNFSIDAEGGLRDKLSDKYGYDVYSQDKVEAYLASAVNFFCT